MIDKEQALEIIDKHDFFNDRAGRELWADKPKEIQDEDIINAHEDYEALKEYILNQPKVGEWIPCNSFLPPRETICLVTLKLAKEMNASIVKFGFLTRNKEWMILCDIGWEKVNSAYVLACMPLPEPFKGETE